MTAGPEVKTASTMKDQREIHTENHSSLRPSDWNQLPANSTSADTVEGFRASSGRTWRTIDVHIFDYKLEIVLYVNNIEKTCCVAWHCPKFSSGTNCIRLTNPVPYMEEEGEEEEDVTKKLYVLCFVNCVHIRLIYCLIL